MADTTYDTWQPHRNALPNALEDYRLPHTYLER